MNLFVVFDIAGNHLVVEVDNHLLRLNSPFGEQSRRLDWDRLGLRGGEVCHRMASTVFVIVSG